MAHEVLAHIPSKTNDGRTFAITRSTEGHFRCSCKTFRLRNRSVPEAERTCCHLRTFFSQQMSKHAPSNTSAAAVLDRSTAASEAGKSRSRKARCNAAYSQFARTYYAKTTAVEEEVIEVETVEAV